MNDAHLHLIVNHFPIIGTIFGTGILITGLFFKNNAVKNTAYCLFIIGAVFSFASMNTGEGAEEIAEKLPGVTDAIIHEHEEMAEKLAIALYILAGVSILGLYTSIKNYSQAKLVSFLTLAITFVAVFLAQQTGTTGGEIRHTEIRANATNEVQNDAGNNETENEN